MWSGVNCLVAGVLHWACNMQSYENPLPVMNLQVHLSQMHMQVLDWMHLLIQMCVDFSLEAASESKGLVQVSFKMHCRPGWWASLTCLGRKEMRNSSTRSKKSENFWQSADESCGGACGSSLTTRLLGKHARKMATFIYWCPQSVYISFETQVIRLACLLPLLTNLSSLQCKAP
jgi:hypothetical protein